MYVQVTDAVHSDAVQLSPHVVAMHEIPCMYMYIHMTLCVLAPTVYMYQIL